MPGILTFAPDSTQPAKTASVTLTDDQLGACASFIAAQNAATPGKYAGVFDLLTRNLHDGLLASLVSTYPSPTVTAAKASASSAQTSLATAQANSNPTPIAPVDPVHINPFP